MNGPRPRQLAVLLLVALLAVAYAVKQRSGVGAAGADEGEARILRAFSGKLSEEWVEAEGTVTRVLPDDEEGSRHQRFILRLPSGHTVLVSHNIDLADRVATLRTGDTVAFRGEYEWNAQGGVVHWTHRDPRGRQHGGWLEHGGTRYE